MEALTFGGKWSLVNPYGEMWIGKWLQSHSAYRMNYICWDADAVPCLQITDYSRCIWKIMHLKKIKMTNNFTNNLEWRELYNCNWSRKLVLTWSEIFVVSSDECKGNNKTNTTKKCHFLCQSSRNESFNCLFRPHRGGVHARFYSLVFPSMLA